MRDSIARALVWVLQRFLPARGRHRNTPTHPAPVNTPAPAVQNAPMPAVEPEREPDPIIWHDRPLVPPYVREHEARQREHEEQERRHHRRQALAAALCGRDYPAVLYVTPGTGLRTVRITGMEVHA